MISACHRKITSAGDRGSIPRERVKHHFFLLLVAVRDLVLDGILVFLNPRIWVIRLVLTNSSFFALYSYTITAGEPDINVLTVLWCLVCG
jgi:hypothetical protein